MTREPRRLRTETISFVGLWLDETGGEPAWIVSDDEIADGQAESTHTVSVYDEDAYREARIAAIARGESRGVPVVETNSSGEETTLWEPEEAVRS